MLGILLHLTFITPGEGGGHTSQNSLFKGVVSLLTYWPLLKRVLDLVAQLGLDTQQLKQADQSWWSMILVVNRYFLNVLTVVQIVCLEWSAWFM